MLSTTTPTFTQYCTGGLNQCNKARLKKKNLKGVSIEKNLSLFTDDKIAYVENPK